MRVNIKLTADELWRFSMYHANRGIMGVTNMFFALVSLCLLIFTWGSTPLMYKLLLLVCVLMFTVWQPVILHRKARRQAESDALRDPMVMTFKDEGFTIAQNGQTVEIGWGQVARVDGTRHLVIIYMDKIRAYVVPRAAVEGREREFQEILQRNLSKDKLKGIVR